MQKPPNWDDLTDIEKAHELGLIDVISYHQKGEKPYAHRCGQCGRLISVLTKD